MPLPMASMVLTENLQSYPQFSPVGKMPFLFYWFQDHSLVFVFHKFDHDAYC